MKFYGLHILWSWKIQHIQHTRIDDIRWRNQLCRVIDVHFTDLMWWNWGVFNVAWYQQNLQMTSPNILLLVKIPCQSFKLHVTRSSIQELYLFKINRGLADLQCGLKIMKNYTLIYMQISRNKNKFYNNHYIRNAVIVNVLPLIYYEILF